MKKGRKKNSVKKKVRRLWARSRANKDNASGQGSEVNNERKSRTAVKSVTATKRTDLKAAQTPAPIQRKRPQKGFHISVRHGLKLLEVDHSLT